MYITPNYSDVLEEKDSLRDLGIMMSNDGHFSSHVGYVCSKVSVPSNLEAPAL
jgi:hypothetical protein